VGQPLGGESFQYAANLGGVNMRFFTEQPCSIAPPLKLDQHPFGMEKFECHANRRSRCAQFSAEIAFSDPFIFVKPTFNNHPADGISDSFLAVGLTGM
jgi:hypothetical protein